MTHVDSVNNVKFSSEPLLNGWGRMGEIKLKTVKALLFDYHGRELWIAKANCLIWDGRYYAKTWAIESAKRKADQAERDRPFIDDSCVVAPNAKKHV